MASGFGTGGFSNRGGSSRGSYGANGNSGSRINSQAGSKSTNNRSKGNAGEPKGQIRDGKTVQYSIKDAKGNTKYIGTTNNPTRRAEEHRESGKLRDKDKLVVETQAASRRCAEKVEAAKLRSHRNALGRNPKHNITGDGKFHQPPLF